MPDTTCGHEGCTCEAREDGYCSDYCARHVAEGGTDADHQCGCGHSQCETATA